MSKNKLQSIKGLYHAQEQALGRALQRTAAEREQQQQQEQDLQGLLAQYRDQHVRSASWSAEQALRFQRFYRQLMSTLSVQGELTSRLVQAEQLQRNAWRAAYQRRLGVEKVIDKQVAQAQEVAKRRERRGGKRPPAEGWSTLNEDS